MSFPSAPPHSQIRGPSKLLSDCHSEAVFRISYLLARIGPSCSEAALKAIFGIAGEPGKTLDMRGLFAVLVAGAIGDPAQFEMDNRGAQAREAE